MRVIPSNSEYVRILNIPELREKSGEISKSIGKEVTSSRVSDSQQKVKGKDPSFDAGSPYQKIAKEYKDKIPAFGHENNLSRQHVYYRKDNTRPLKSLKKSRLRVVPVKQRIYEFHNGVLKKK